MQVVDASGNQYGPAGIEIIGADGKPKGGGGGGGTTYILRHSFATPLDYIGLAPIGTLETDPVWNITRLTTTLSGTSLSQTAVGAWTNRTSLIYT